METKRLLQRATAARVLDAAERCMGRAGLQRVSMGDVAAEAGVSRGTVYRYYPTREALVEAVLDRAAKAFVEASEPRVDAGRTLADQVAQAAVFITEHRDDLERPLRRPDEVGPPQKAVDARAGGAAIERERPLRWPDEVGPPQEVLDARAGGVAVEREFTLRLPAGTDSLLAVLLSVHIGPLLETWVDFWGPRRAAAAGRGELRAGLDHRQAGEWIVRLMFTFAVMPSVTVDLADPAAVRDFVRLHLQGVLA